MQQSTDDFTIISVMTSIIELLMVPMESMKKGDGDGDEISNDRGKKGKQL